MISGSWRCLLGFLVAVSGLLGSWGQVSVEEVDFICKVLGPSYGDLSGLNVTCGEAFMDCLTLSERLKPVGINIICFSNSISSLLISELSAGSIPTEIGHLTSISSLEISSTQFTGTIPTQIGLLGDLNQLKIEGNNNLTGTIPSEIGSLTSLGILVISGNSLLGGTIPWEIGCNLPDLVVLAIDGNDLVGTIPPELGLLHSLFILSLAGNKLEGTIPRELGYAPNKFDPRYLWCLNGISLDSTKSALSTMYLQKNRISGTIPPELGDLSSLTVILFHDNSLSGTIPPELGTEKLSILDLGFNSLTGTIPGFKTSKLRRISLNDNQLIGTIPCELSNCSSLSSIHLQNNKLIGNLPPELGTLKRLHLLDTRGNSLSGGVPEEYCGVSWSSLFFGGGLEGCFPPCLSNASSHLNETFLCDLQDSTFGCTDPCRPALACNAKCNSQFDSYTVTANLPCKFTKSSASISSASSPSSLTKFTDTTVSLSSTLITAIYASNSNISINSTSLELLNGGVFSSSQISLTSNTTLNSHSSINSTGSVLLLSPSSYILVNGSWVDKNSTISSSGQVEVVGILSLSNSNLQLDNAVTKSVEVSLSDGSIVARSNNTITASKIHINSSKIDVSRGYLLLDTGDISVDNIILKGSAVGQLLNITGGCANLSSSQLQVVVDAGGEGTWHDVLQNGCQQYDTFHSISTVYSGCQKVKVNQRVINGVLSFSFKLEGDPCSPLSVGEWVAVGVSIGIFVLVVFFIVLAKTNDTVKKWVTPFSGKKHHKQQEFEMNNSKGYDS